MLLAALATAIAPAAHRSVRGDAAAVTAHQGAARTAGGLMDATQRLRRQHEQILAAFEELELTVDAEQRIVLLAHVGMRLKAHAAAEEAVFYPSIEEMTAGSAVERARGAHVAIDALLDEMLGADAMAERIGDLRRLVERHFADEERELFPLAERLHPLAREALSRQFDDYLAACGDGADDALAVAGAQG